MPLLKWFSQQMGMVWASVSNTSMTQNTEPQKRSWLSLGYILLKESSINKITLSHCSVTVYNGENPHFHLQCLPPGTQSELSLYWKRGEKKSTKQEYSLCHMEDSKTNSRNALRVLFVCLFVLFLHDTGNIYIYLPLYTLFHDNYGTHV